MEKSGKGLLDRNQQDKISNQFGMPVADLNRTSAVTSKTAETVALYYFVGTTLTADAGQLAGVNVIGKLANNNVLNDLGDLIANKDNTSLSFTSTALTSEVAFPFSALETYKDNDDRDRLDAIVTGFSNGQYCVDYRRGVIYGKKTSAQTSLTATAYKVPDADVTLTGDINVDTTSIDTSGYIGKASGTNADFTTAYASGTTITLSNFPVDVTAFVADDIVSVVQVATGGAVTKTYTRDDATMSITANVLTVTGATFTNSDTFVIYTNVPNTRDINVDSSSVSTSGYVGKKSGTNADFTTAYTAGTTITFTGMPSDVTSFTAEDIVSVVQIATSGAVTRTYTRDDAIMAMTGDVLTITGATFINTDTFVVYTNVARNVEVNGIIAHDAPVSTTKPVLVGDEATNFDGSALPNAVGAEGDLVRTKSSLSGVRMFMPVSEDGSSTPLADHDAAIGTGIGESTVIQGLESKNFDGSALPNVVGTEGDAVRMAGSLTGITYAMLTGENGSSTPIVDHDTAIGTGLGVGTVIQGLESKNFDGSALPNVVGTEGDAVRMAGSLTGVVYTMLTDEDGSDTPLVAESAAISAANGGSVGLMTMLEAASTQKTAVTTGDAVRPIGNLNGEQVIAGHTWATNSNRGEEIDPISSHHTEETLADVTNETSATNYYYMDMDGYRYFSIQCETSGTTPTDTLTVTIEASNQDDGTAQASAAYQDVTQALFGVANWVDTDFFVFQDTPIAAKYVRVKTVTSGGANDADYTIFAKRSF